MLSNGIIVEWTSNPPADLELASVKKIMKCDVNEMNFTKGTCTIFLPSPRQITQNQSDVQISLCPPDSGLSKARWLLIAIPFHKDHHQPFAELVPFDLT